LKQLKNSGDHEKFNDQCYTDRHIHSYADNATDKLCSGLAMLISLQLVVFGLAISAVTGCASPSDVPTQNPLWSPVSEFQEHIQRNGSITFRSWNGKALRMDSDTELTFFPKNVVHMFEWGYTLASYSGSYEIQPAGRITVEFKGFNQGWPDMLLDRDATSLLLRPADAAQGFVMGTRGGAYVPGDKGSYWPFRVPTANEEKEVQKMIREHGYR
jgi:hypothetical protein